MAVQISCHKTPTDKGFQPDRAEIIGTVSKVKDGDTITIASDEKIAVCIYGIGAPEKIPAELIFRPMVSIHEVRHYAKKSSQ